MPPTSRQRTGAAAEALVARGLEEAGWRILGRNVRLGREELDLVAIDPGPPAALAIVEVRWRATRAYGLAEETLDHRKRTALRRAVHALLDRGMVGEGTPVPRLPLRVDVVAVDVDSHGRLAVRHHRGIGW